MNSPRVSLVVLLVLAFCMPRGATARWPKEKEKASPTPHHHTVIESVSDTSITVKQANGGSTTYKITKFTEITFKGQTVPASQLQAGMRVDVVPDAADPSAAGQIMADDPPKDPTPKPKK